MYPIANEYEKRIVQLIVLVVCILFGSVLRVDYAFHLLSADPIRGIK